MPERLFLCNQEAVSELSSYSTEGQRRSADITGKLIYNEQNEIVYGFGKNKGNKIIEDVDYANWVLGADFPEDTKAIIRQLLLEEDCENF